MDMIRNELVFMDEELEKWGTYFRYFYFYEEMTFEKFLERVKQGHIPRRGVVDWEKVKRAFV